MAESDVPRQTLESACAGEKHARAQIYAAVAPGTLTLIRRMIGQRALAEDIFQDTMMLLFERLPQFRAAAPLGAWVRQIAISRCLMYLRSPWRRAWLALESCAETDLPESLVTPGFRGDLIDLDRALARLTPTARAVVWMYEVEGYSHQEIAHEFGRSVSFSKSQLARAHAKLRAWFEPQDDRPSCTLI